ncbi:lytic transglycosylase domain-containing protein [Parafrankia elaeagni]|uniref:lytic transglycosylase domain-containing protein n=1 Tax=Parafrankia elaeagni TaxID=222534 RepID=UPI0003788622|nr:lytic transglycosylase domain-containing protein [Parafrankia elaeagni]
MTRRAPAPAILALVCVLGLISGCSHIFDRAFADVPDELVPLFQAAAATYGGLSAAQLAAQARVESSFDPSAVSPAGARGLMQFLPTTWAQFGVDGNGDGRADPLEPRDAIPSAAHYEAHLASSLADLPGDRTSLILAAYNAGPQAVRTAGGIPDFHETRAYVARVHDWAATYRNQL